MDASHISVIIPTYNGRHILDTTLPGNITKLHQYGITDILIVDDSSTDDTQHIITTQYPAVTYLCTPQNVGFGQTCNLGARAATGTTLWFLNNDMHIEQLDSQIIDQYLNCTDTFAVVPQINRTRDGRLINESLTGGYWAGGWFSAELCPDTATSKLYKEGMPVLWACGGSFFIQSKTFQAFDGFDPLFSPFYFEDLDLSYRGWKSGQRCIYTASSSCQHLHQATIGTLFSKAHVNHVHRTHHYLFIWKNITYWPYRIHHMLTIILKLITLQIIDIKAILNAYKKWRILRPTKPQKPTRSDPKVLALFKEYH